MHTEAVNDESIPSGIPPEDWATTPASVRGWVRSLLATVQQVQQRLQDLESRLNQNSHNSSQPPSRDQKHTRPPKRRTRHRGAKLGHPKAGRPLVEQPDRVIEVRVKECHQCHTDLRAVTAHKIIRRQITELPELRPVVIETQQHEVVCPVCQQVQRGALPVGLEATRQFGPRLEATVVYFQHQQHLSYERTEAMLQEVFGIALSEGGEACILERAGAVAQAAAETIRAEVQQSAVVGSDETGARVDGRTWWQWAFVTAQAIYHVIRPSRGVDVIQEVMGDAWAETWVCDCWSPQLKAPAEHIQLCLGHQIRNLQGLMERRPHLRWAREMQQLFRTAIHLAKRRERLTERGFRWRRTELETSLERLLGRVVTTPAAQPLLKRYRKHRDHLFVFLHDSAVPFHNNACERALRPSVIHRKVSGGFRSAWGAQAYAALASVIDTAKLRGQRLFETLVSLMGKPVLPFLTAYCRE